MTFIQSRFVEFVTFMSTTPNSELYIYDTPNSASRGVAKLKTYYFSSDDFQITYNKWFVEDIETATKEQLFGYMYHDRLAGGVNVKSKLYGNHILFGKDAFAVVSACENAHPNPISMSKMTSEKPSR